MNAGFNTTTTTTMNESSAHRQSGNEFHPRDELKKRKSMEDVVANALLSLDSGNHSTKRYRSTTPLSESREMSGSESIQTPDERESAETSGTEASSPASSSKLSRRFMARFEEKTPSKDVSFAEVADSNELASAMALASLAHPSPSLSQSTPHPSCHPERMIYKRHPAHMHSRPPITSQMSQPPLNGSQMSHIGMPSFQSRPMYAGYYNNAPYNNAPYNNAPYNNAPYNYGSSSTSTFHNQSPKQWACDFCDRASFSTFDETCRHEKVCSHNPENHQNVSSPVPRPFLSSRSASMTSVASGSSKRSLMSKEASIATSPVDDDESQFFCAIIPLAVPSADPEWLSEMNCYIRKKCIQVFSATPDDVLKSSKRGRISLKQVGIRCVFCSHQDIETRAMSAVSYPVSSSGIYESVKRWVKIHLPLCQSIPSDVKDKIVSLEQVAFLATTRQYWIDSAKALGIDDTRSGLRFIHNVSDEGNAEKASKALLSSKFGAHSDTGKGKTGGSADLAPTGKYIVFPEDESIITPFLYTLLRQVEPCQFTDADRYIARSRCSSGFNGFQCRHCYGHAGLGKYFPISTKALSTNSTSQNIFSHVLKCRKCPEEVKEQLKALKHDKRHWTRRTTGWRQKFFEEIWERLHGGGEL